MRFRENEGPESKSQTGETNGRYTLDSRAQDEDKEETNNKIKDKDNESGAKNQEVRVKCQEPKTWDKGMRQETRNRT